MLVLSRKPGEKIHIGDNITITVTYVKGNRVKLGIEAPEDVSIVRGELQQITDEFRMAPAEVETDHNSDADILAMA